jgi:DNA invertase Pin-like site-specific DNA recombinase
MFVKERQAGGISKAKGKYTGRKANTELHQKIKDSLESGMSIRRTAFACGCGVSIVQAVKKGVL